MSQEVVQTPVEPLVLGDDRTASIVRSAKVEGASGGLRVVEKALSAVDYDDDEAEDDDASEKPPDAIPSIADSVPLPTTSPRTENPRVDSQNPLVFEPEPPEGTVAQSTMEDQREIAHVEAPTEKLTSPEISTEGAILTPEPPQPVQMETKATVDTATMLALLHDFLYHKIAENQCNTHAKEIHEFITANLTDKQQLEHIPQVVLNLSQQFQKEAMAKEVSVDIQSSICLIEQMLLPEGRRSPLQDMYTAEEEEMLNQLVHTGSSNNVLA